MRRISFLIFLLLLLPVVFAKGEYVMYEADENGIPLDPEKYGFGYGKIITEEKADFMQKFSDYHLEILFEDENELYYEPIPMLQETKISSNLISIYDSYKITLLSSNNGDPCGEEISYNGIFLKGFVLAKEYSKTPDWAKPFGGAFLGFHHSGIIIEEGDESLAQVMEAVGFARNKDDEIQKFPFKISGWKYKGQREEEDCHNYERIVVLDVNMEDNQREKVVDYAKNQDNKSFYLGFDMDKAGKNIDSHFYCSKLIWQSYYEGAGIDLDKNGMWFVSPSDLVNDDDTYEVGKWEKN